MRQFDIYERDNSRRNLKPKVVARCIGEILLDSQIQLRGDDRRMAEGQLDLLERGTPAVGELRVRSAKVVGLIFTPIRSAYFSTTRQIPLDESESPKR